MTIRNEKIYLYVLSGIIHNYYSKYVLSLFSCIRKRNQSSFMFRVYALLPLREKWALAVRVRQSCVARFDNLFESTN
jgi:hypothetical protein